MKRKALNELKQKTAQELLKMQEETRKALVKTRMEAKTEKIKNRRILSRTRDDLARILTILKQKELKEEK